MGDRMDCIVAHDIGIKRAHESMLHFEKITL